MSTGRGGVEKLRLEDNMAPALRNLSFLRTQESRNINEMLDTSFRWHNEAKHIGHFFNKPEEWG